MAKNITTTHKNTTQQPARRHGTKTALTASTAMNGGQSSATNVAGPELIEQAARAIASEVSYHLETMYPAVTTAVAWNSCKRSLSGLIQNTMKRLGDAAESGTMDAVIKSQAQHRREMGKLRKISEMAEAARKRREQEQKNEINKIADTMEAEQQQQKIQTLSTSGTVNSIWRHKKRGTEYQIMLRGKLQVEGHHDMQDAVVYQGIEDGQVWIRPDTDFFDGRFELVSEGE